MKADTRQDLKEMKEYWQKESGSSQSEVGAAYAKIHIDELDELEGIIESDCSMCANYDGFGQCLEHGNNLREHCAEYKNLCYDK